MVDKQAKDEHMRSNWHTGEKVLCPICNSIVPVFTDGKYKYAYCNECDCKFKVIIDMKKEIGQ